MCMGGAMVGGYGVKCMRVVLSGGFASELVLDKGCSMKQWNP